jgi:hypothetical protein
MRTLPCPLGPGHAVQNPLVEPRRWPRQWISVLLAVWISTPASAAADQQQIVLREHVRRQWTDELISYPFEAARGTCDASSLRLMGPDGPLAVQLSDIDRWPETDWVRSARLWLVADLAPLAENVYTVHYGPAGPLGPAPASDLNVSVQPEQVELTTRRFGARLRLGGQTFEPSQAASEVPGPLIGLRLDSGTGSAAAACSATAGSAAGQQH